MNSVMKMIEVARNIKAGMAYTGLTPEKMAKACGVSRSTWFRWMNEPETITLPHLFIIAAKLGCKPSELLEKREWTTKS